MVQWNNQRKTKKCENCDNVIPKVPTWKKLCISCYLESKGSIVDSATEAEERIERPIEVSDYYEAGRGDVYEQHWGNEVPEEMEA